MGVLLLLTSLVLSLCPLQLSRGHSFAFCRAVKPVLLPNTEQSRGTATLGTKLLSMHFNPQPSCLCSSNARVKESGYKQKEKEKQNKAALPVLLCCCFGISKNKNLHRQIWVSQCISYRNLAGNCTRVKKKKKNLSHKSSESHQRVAKHFREQLTGAQTEQPDPYLQISLPSCCQFSYLGKSQFYSPLSISCSKMLPRLLIGREGKLVFHVILALSLRKMFASP